MFLILSYCFIIRTELLRRIQRYSIAQAKCLLIKHSKDDRYNNSFVITHDKRFDSLSFYVIIVLTHTIQMPIGHAFRASIFIHINVHIAR